ncbi:type IA DNA topoisomerase [Bifidobacterium pseudocatenulatum]|uniref:type IA DNA topoisomerase n=1 Tax=Bifidobacterium pseudocatenulatum TaxID=28026 RepID=UPI000E440B37|nr:type IA DNA topoisomerase [Bifidobacterium pseudocatenulatum]RGL74857.1 type IA DNA topoisomerase [Bifidobacterium pseudocatenulatum]
MRLIIAEKHSVGQAIAQALDGRVEKYDGYMQVGDDLVTWAQGHLVDLAAPDEYNDHDWGKWSLDTLPIDPTPAWQWKVSREKSADRQYKVIAGLMRRNDVESLVNACDPDREGEAIFRRIVAYAGIDKPMRRLWVASLEEDAIRDALVSMKDESDYRGLADAAMIRAKADWLIGMNASRAYSLVYNARFTVGRVQTPTLAMIVDRDRRIAGHVAQPYWKVVAPMGGWKLTGERLDKREDAETLLRIVNAPDFRFGIFAVERKQRHDAPPRLYDLTNLQKDMSRLHGLTAACTLAALQALYEKRLTTYPRTDSQYVTTADLETLRGLTEGDRRVEGFIDPDVKPNQPRLELTVNDAKVAGHTAILPTMQADARALDELGEDERLVLTRVVRRMWEAVGEDYVHDTTMVIANIDPHWCEKHPDEGRFLSEGECRFISRSDQPVSLGWHAIERAKPQEDLDDDNDMAGNIIPANLATGVSIAPIPHGGATLSEGQTKPPKPFTEATLLAAMEHASRWVEDKELKAALDDDESHSGGIGTPATRADVIEKLIRTGYVARKGKQLRSTRQGQSLIDVIAPRLKDVALTADMERQLSQVEHNHADPTQVEMEFRDLAAGIPSDAQNTVQQDHVQTKTRNTESFGDCPRCGKPVIKSGKVFQCSTNRREKQPDGTWKTMEGCGWRAWTTIAGKTVTDSAMRGLLAGQKISLKGFTSRKGSKFDATLLVDKDKGIVFDFGK